MDLTAHIEPLIGWLSEGKTQSSYCEKHGIVPMTLQRFIAASPNLADKLFQARALGAVMEADAMVNIAARTDLHPGVQRNQIDVHKWRASKFLPKVFGDKLDVTVTEKLDVSGALIEARKRAPQPLRNLNAGALTQDADYTVIPLITRTDKESAAPVQNDTASVDCWDPFD